MTTPLYVPSQVRRLPGQAPIIPEITKAYQNDPRELLARQALANGTSNSPVAAGKYGTEDAIARILQAGLGGYQDKQMRAQYGSQDDQTVAERARAAQNLLAAQAPAQAATAGVPGAAPTGAPVNPAVASQVAGMMGAPAPATPSVAPTAAMAPRAPGMPPMPPQGPPPPGLMGMGGPPPSAPMLGGLPAGAPPPVAPGMVGSPPIDPRTGRPFVQQGVALADPLAGKGRVTSKYGDPRPNGRTHDGTDFAAPAGTPIGAAGGGTVLRVWDDTQNGGGNSVLIRHGDGSISGYAHLAAVAVKTGDQVQPGQPIGTVGKTGNATGDSLHFTYRDPSGKRVDPLTLKFGSSGQAPTPADDQANALAGTGGTLATNYGVPLMPMPTAPTPVGPTQSQGLQNGLRLAAGGNPYESARAQDLITAGEDNQTALNEAAATRQNELNSVGYKAGLDRYANDRTQTRAENYGTAERVAGQGFQTSERQGSEGFTAGQNAATRAQQAQLQTQALGAQATQGQLNREAERSNLEYTVGSKEYIARLRALQMQQARMQSPQNQKFVNDSNAEIQKSDTSAELIKNFLALNAKNPTGNAVETYAPGLAKLGSKDLQTMDGITQQLTLLGGLKMKGSISDKEEDMLRDATLAINKTPDANAKMGRMLIAKLHRDSEFEYERQTARAEGNTDFGREWDAFRNSVPMDSDTSFQDWKAKLPKYGADGKPVTQ